MSETLAVNLERNFEISATPCLITKQFDRCISVKLGAIQTAPEPDYPEGRVVEVVGAFSRAGLHALLADLESVPDPIGLPTQAEVTDATPYQWAVILADGEHYQQYPAEGGEMPFREIHLPDVEQFWIIPRESPDGRPWYGLVRGKGWVMRPMGFHSPAVPMDLPQPGDEPFEWHYYRRPVITFGLGCGRADQLPPHTVQVLGWRIPGDPDTVFEIGIESDGCYQVWKREPLDDPRWG